jgi:serine/threonine protein phosphatase PrpC
MVQPIEFPPMPPKKGTQMPPPLPKKTKREELEGLSDLLTEIAEHEVEFRGQNTQFSLESIDLSFGSKTHKNNEDTATVDGDSGLAILCDGMGGEGDGDIASQTAVRELKKALADIKIDEKPERVALALEAAIRSVNGKIDRGKTTLSAIKIVVDQEGKKKAVIASVGDSKVFLSRKDGNGGFESLTEEQTAWAYFFENFRSQKDMEPFIKYFDKQPLGNNIPRKYFQQEIDNILAQPEAERESYILNKVAGYASIPKSQVKEDAFYHLYRRLNKTSEGLSAARKSSKVSIQIKIVDLEVGDIIFLTSDGLHDNLPVEEMKKIMKNRDITSLAELANKAKEMSTSIFAMAKPDDITIGGFKIAA